MKPNTCGNCQTRSKCTDCSSCATQNLCNACLGTHYLTSHPRNGGYNKVLSIMAETQVKNGLLSCVINEDLIVNSTTRANTHSQSPWFKLAKYIGLETPTILVLNPPASEDEEYVANVEQILQSLGLQAYAATQGDSITLLTAAPSDQEIFANPQLSLRSQTKKSLSGIIINPDSKPGKISKRSKVFSPAEGNLCTDIPSKFDGRTKVGLIQTGATPIQFEKRRTNFNGGDGSGMITVQAAKQLCEAFGVTYNPNMVALYTVVTGANFAFKGQFLIVPDNRIPSRKHGTSMVIDEECFNTDVLSTRFTIGKMLPRRHKKNRRHVYVEPLVQYQVTSRFISTNELIKQAETIARKENIDEWKRALAEPQDSKFGMLEADPWSRDPEVVKLFARLNLEKDTARLAYMASEGSIFASTAAMDRVLNQTNMVWDSHIQRSDPMPGIYLSGEKVWLMNHIYALEQEPARGYADLVWNRYQPDQITGVLLNDQDLHEQTEALETADNDDILTVICLDNAVPKPGETQDQLLILRTPLSVDGGICLNLQPETAEKLKQLGYHFYDKQAGHQWPDLYKRVDGEPLYPDHLHAVPLTDPIQWSNDQAELISLMVRLNRFRATMGQVCNLMANLDYAGAYSPSLKFNMSEGVIDPVLNASADPTPIVAGLTQATIEFVRAGGKLDSCVSDRITKALLEADPTLKVRTTCHHDHQQVKKAMATVLLQMQIRINRFKLMANGPAAALVKTFDTEIVAIVADAFQRRTKYWADVQNAKYKKQNPQSEEDENSTYRTGYRSNRDDRDNREQEQEQEDEFGPYTPEQLNQMAASYETGVIQRAYQKAAQLPGYEPGSFNAIWVQIALSRGKRFGYVHQRELKAISTHNLAKGLPETERVAYHQWAANPPTAVLRTKEPLAIQQAGQATVAKDGTNYRLVSIETGELLADLRQEAKQYVGAKLTNLGQLPNYGSTQVPQETNLMILEVDLTPPGKPAAAQQNGPDPAAETTKDTEQDTERQTATATAA